MINLALTVIDVVAESATEIILGIYKNVPVLGNAEISSNSLCTTGRASINFYYSPNLFAKFSLVQVVYVV